MKVLLTTLLTLVSFASVGQQKFSIKLNQKTVGSAAISQVEDDQIFTNLISNMCLITLDDTTEVSSNILFKENTKGQLLEVKSEYIDSKETLFSKTFINKDSTALGPFGIQQKSSLVLNQIGDTTSFYTYSTDLNILVKTYRKVLSQELIDVREIWIVIDSTAQLPVTINKFDKNFKLYSSQYITAIGQVQLQTYQASDSIISVYENNIHRRSIPSNVILPDPQSINAIALSVTFNDTIRSINLADNTFLPLTSDSLEFTQSKSSNQWILSDDMDLFSLADSITFYLKSDLAIATKLSQHCYEEEYDFPVTKLITMARSIIIPSRFVHGYHYQNGQWIYKYWCEMGIDGEWIMFDPNTDIKPNPALYLPLGKSFLNQGFVDITNAPDVIEIQINRFLRENKLHLNLNKKAVIFEEQVLDIPGIGLKMVVPKRFSIDSTALVRNALITLNSKLGERLTVSYFSKDFLSRTAINQVLDDFIIGSQIKTNSQFKFENYTKESSQRYIMIIKQGNSYIEINHYGLKVHSFGCD